MEKRKKEEEERHKKAVSGENNPENKGDEDKEGGSEIENEVDCETNRHLTNQKKNNFIDA